MSPRREYVSSRVKLEMVESPPVPVRMGGSKCLVVCSSLFNARRVSVYHFQVVRKIRYDDFCDELI